MTAHRPTHSLRSNRYLSPLVLAGVLVCSAAPTAGARAENRLPELVSLDLDQLMSLEVTTASKKAQQLSNTAAAAYVITHDDIVRSGAMSVPEVLRLAPGVDVGQISPGQWSVTIRGFGGRFANKLLVLIDGRAIYTPTFNGVYWEQQDLVLEDIEQIEVIRGPGASLWGANAVNGIINIITRHSEETTGGLAGATVGTYNGTVQARYGATTAKQGYWRAYAKGDLGEPFDSPEGTELQNGYRRQSAGFRADLPTGEHSSLSLQAQVLLLSNDQVTDFPDLYNPPSYLTRVSETNQARNHWISAQWEYAASSESLWTISSYLSQYTAEAYSLEENVTTFDLSIQQQWAITARQEIVWGMGYRNYTDDIIDSPPLISVAPDALSRNIHSIFIQDEIEVLDDTVWVTIGSKLEHNDFTGYEFQPSLRALWRPDGNTSLWSSVSRASRTPSRLETTTSFQAFITDIPGVPLPVVASVNGQPEFAAEDLTAWELGVRKQLTTDFSLDIALFYHQYDNLREGQDLEVTQQSDHFLADVIIGNVLQGTGKGVELAARWQVNDHWHIQAAYTQQSLDLSYKPGFERLQSNPNALEASPPSPESILSLSSYYNISDKLGLNLWLRSNSATPPVAHSHSTTTLDAQLLWRVNPEMQISLVGKNLLDDSHHEFDDEVFTANSVIPRMLLARMKYRF